MDTISTTPDRLQRIAERFAERALHVGDPHFAAVLYERAERLSSRGLRMRLAKGNEVPRQPPPDLWRGNDLSLAL